MKMNGLQEMIERARKRTLGEMDANDEMEQILMLRRDGNMERRMKPEQEKVMGETPSGGIEDGVVEYFRKMGMSDDLIYQHLGIGGKR
jgi:hypothetical protein